ncbi:MAG: polysaccharide biosynthesis/export family protein [Prevotella sp.]|jgi:polysaccharide export outer membrane protein|nr:polysaccharide biosynthesis/export family protein [Prevotella sp.]
MWNKIKIIGLFLSIICYCNSCVTNKQTDLLQDIKLNYPQLTATAEEYKIIPGDQLSVTVYTAGDNDETARMFAGYRPNFTYQGLNESTGVNVGSQSRGLENVWSKPIMVYADGTMTFPYIGKMYVQGLTILQVRNLLSEKLDAIDAGTTADVTLSNRYFSILGEAGANRITMPSTSMTILEALSIAGNIGPYGDRSKVTVIRQTATGSETKTFDLRSKEIIDTEFYYIQPNDVIYIPQTSKKFLDSTTSFSGVFGLLLSVSSLIVVILRVF